ncbi:hypothetical protein [Maribellus mangrovi]|uniref:hypothetical protein n=1 Tax=Maribellus mangrovi TaxID=3133146 RepID=UPI0030EB7B2A
MKKICLINFTLSFLAIVGVDTDATPLWAVGLLLVWLVVSVFLLKRVMPELWEDKK